MKPNDPYSTPSSPLVNDFSATPDEKIDKLDVSDKWKTKFKAISAAGGPKMTKFKELSVPERRQAFSFNLLAFLFGPFYYFAKGMWKRGLTLFLAAAVLVVVLGMILEYFGFGEFARALGYGVGAVFAVRANIDYYKKMVLEDHGWI